MTETQENWWVERGPDKVARATIEGNNTVIIPREGCELTEEEEAIVRLLVERLP